MEIYFFVLKGKSSKISENLDILAVPVKRESKKRK